MGERLVTVDGCRLGLARWYPMNPSDNRYVKKETYAKSTFQFDDHVFGNWCSHECH